MKRTGILVVALAAASLLTVVSDAQAQSRYRPPSTTRPSVTSYFNMVQYGSGYGYGQYGMSPLLAPYLQRNKSTASRRRDQTDSTNTGLTTDPTVQRARAGRAGVAPTGQTGVAPTGTGSVFMNYSHYFQPQGTAQRGMRRR